MDRWCERQQHERWNEKMSNAFDANIKLL